METLQTPINKSVFDRFLNEDLFLASSGKDCIIECTKTTFYKLVLKNTIDPDDEELNVLYFTCEETKTDNEIVLSCKSVECDDDENNVIVIDEFEIRLTHSEFHVSILFDPMKHASYMRRSVKDAFNRLIQIML